MDDGDAGDLPAAPHTDPRFFLATTIATVVLAGSVLVWRSLPTVMASHQQGAKTRLDPEPSPVANRTLAASFSDNESPDDGQLVSDAGVVDHAGFADHEETREAKNSRSKERRRRGKDPVKEMSKTAKKNKGVVKPSRTPEFEVTEVGPSNPPVKAGPSQHPRELLLSTLSRSSSESVVKKRKSADWGSTDYGSDSGRVENDRDRHAPPTSSTSKTSAPALDPPLITTVLGSSHIDSSSSRSSEATETPEFPSIPLPDSSGTSQSGTSLSTDAVSTPSTSPALSPTARTPPPSEANLSRPKEQNDSSKAVITSASPSSSRKEFPGPWDWDGAGPSSSANLKPPRLRSKSRGPGSATSVNELSRVSEVHNASSADPFLVKPTPGAARSSGELTFPTLNVPPSSSTTSSPSSSKTGTSANGASNGTTGNTPRRAPTPRRPSTPHSGTNTPPPLSVQTQLASLRGALEAARMREEKAKLDMEKHSKDLELLRYELVASRQREAELQTQVRYLLHNHSFSSMFSSSNLPNGNLPTASTPASNHSTPAHLQMSSASMILANGVLSSPPMVSPMAIPPGVSFYSYPQSPHHIGSPQLQSNLYTMLYPQTSPGMINGSTSGTSSNAGSSSGESRSPDLSGSSSFLPVQRGRGGLRGFGEEDDAAGFDGWVLTEGTGMTNGDRNHDSYSGDEDDEGGDEVNELLADAILKRPGSIRGLSSKRKKDREGVDHVEFTFPSISDFGNVTPGRVHGTSVEATIAPEARATEEANGEAEQQVMEALEESCEETPKIEDPPQRGIELLQPIADEVQSEFVVSSDRQGP